jgi:hypothetical protein
MVSKDMSVTRLFRRHLLLTARLIAGTPLARDQEVPTADQLDELIEKAELQKTFVVEAAAARARGSLEDSKFAVDALIDQAARAKFKQVWGPRNPDPNVGATFYRKMLDRRKLLKGLEGSDEVQNLYVLCILMGHQGDQHLRESPEVKQSIKEVVKHSADHHFPLIFSPAPQHDHDDEIFRVYWWARATVGLFAGALTLAWIIFWMFWLGFPDLAGRS